MPDRAHLIVGPVRLYLPENYNGMLGFLWWKGLPLSPRAKALLVVSRPSHHRKPSFPGLPPYFTLGSKFFDMIILDNIWIVLKKISISNLIFYVSCKQTMNFLWIEMLVIWVDQLFDLFLVLLVFYFKLLECIPS